MAEAGSVGHFGDENVRDPSNRHHSLDKLRYKLFLHRMTELSHHPGKHERCSP